jgi:hypothetical protein
MDEPWVKILNEWQKTHTALTIPFLLGALQPPGASTSAGIAELRALIDSIRNRRAEGYYHYIRPCSDVGNYLAITRINSTYGPKGATAIPPDSDKSPCSLYASSLMESPASAVERLVTTLWNEIEPFVSKGLFSYRDGAFRPFNDDDLRLIVAARR